MKSSNRTGHPFIATLALVVGVLVLFYGHHSTIIRNIDLTLIQIPHASEPNIWQHDTKNGTATVLPLVEKPATTKPFQLIHITDDPGRIFETTPPSALDYAVILESLHNRGHQHINLTTKLHWENDPGLLAAGLDLRLALFRSAVLPIALTHGPREGAMPKMLERALIPTSQIHGDSSLIPQVNRTTFPPSIKGNAPGVMAGFYHIQNNPSSEGNIAMLARWTDKGMLPSHRLLTIMQACGISPDQLTIHCGKHIMLGDHGPVIAIDAFGQTPIPTAIETPPFSSPLDADTIVTQKNTSIQNPSIALIHAHGSKTIQTNTLSEQDLSHTLAAIHTFPTTGKGTIYHQLPKWIIIAILILISLIIYPFHRMTRGSQHLAYALTATLLVSSLLALMDLTQHWIPLSAPLALILFAYSTVFFKNKGTMHDERSSEVL